MKKRYLENKSLDSFYGPWKSVWHSPNRGSVVGIKKSQCLIMACNSNLPGLLVFKIKYHTDSLLHRDITSSNNEYLSDVLGFYVTLIKHSFDLLSIFANFNEVY